MKITSLLGMTLLASASLTTTASAAPPAVGTTPLDGSTNLKVADFGRIILPGATDSGLREIRQRPAPMGAAAAGIARKSLSGASFYTWMGPTDTEPGGWYSFDTDGSYTLQWTNIFSQLGINITNGWMRDGRLCGLGVFNMGGMIAYYNYVEFNPTTGEMLKEVSVGPDNTIDMGTYYYSAAYVPSENRIYGYTRNHDETGFNFCSSPADDIGDITVILELEYSGSRANSLCYNAEEDCFYGVTFGGDFVKVDREGTQTNIFTLPLEELKNEKAALVYSPYDGCYLYTPQYYGYATQLYYIYPESKEMRFVRNFPTDNQFFFLLDESFTFNPEAPARPKAVSEDFLPGSLDGSIRLRMPENLADGSPLTGSLTWNLYIDNVKTRSAEAEAGSEVTIEIDGLAQGEHVIRVSCANAAGEGLPYVLNRYFGNGVPMAPESVTMTETSVSWTPVTTALLDGYLEPGKMRYEVYVNNRFIGSTDQTSIDIELDENVPVSAYYAYVAASCNSQTSERTQSNKVIFGAPLDLPYTVVPTQEQADLCRVFNLDGSPDYGTWEFSEARWHEPVFASGWSFEKADDWLILPPVNCADLTHAYRLSIDAICGGLIGKDERFEVWCGNEPDPAAMNTLIIPETQVTEFITEGWETFTNLFVPKASGATYIAVRAVSPPEQKSLIIRKIVIEPTDEVADVPSAPADLQVSGKSDPDLTATISFTMPTSTIAGSDIAADADLKVKAGVGEKWTERSAAPGEKVTMTIDTYQGDNRIDVFCILNGQSGQSANTSIFTGTIPPNFVENLAGEVTRDNMGVHLTWSEPLGGQENLEGYYSPEGMHYWLMEVQTDPEYGDQSWVPTLDLGNVNEYTFTLPEGSDLRYKNLGISAANNGGRSEAIWYIFKQIGTPYAPEVMEDFDNGSQPALHYGPIRIATPTAEYNGTWEFCLPEELGDDHWDPAIPYAMIAYTENEEGGKTRLELPKFTSENVKDPGLTLTVWTGRPCGKVAIYANTFGLAGFEKIYDVPDLNDGWQKIVVPLPEKFRDMPWVHLAIDAELPNNRTFTLVGNYSYGTVDPSGVSVAPADGPQVIFGGKGEIVAVGMKAGMELNVFSIDGRRVATTVTTDHPTTSVKVPAGIYTVGCGDINRKVIVR